MLISTIQDHAGEPGLQMRYRDPTVLQAMGYEALVIAGVWGALPGVLASEQPVAQGAKAVAWPMPRRPKEVEAAIEGQVAGALKLGMKVFFYLEPILPAHLAEKHAAGLCTDGSGRLCPGKEAAAKALRQLVEALLARWPGAAGVVMGNATGTCPACREMPALESVARWLAPLQEIVCGARGKLLVQRIDPQIMANGVTSFQEWARSLPASEQRVFSFCLPKGDPRQMEFLRSRLGTGSCPTWVEFSCENAVEGKGAFPNYQAPAWRQFFGELLANGGEVSGGAEWRARLGVWGQGRGGGFGGPYPQREEWLDANVRALADLYREPESDPADLATRWAAEIFGIAESSTSAPAIAELLLISPEVIRKLLYVSVLPGEAVAPVAPFLQNDLLDVEAIWLAASRLVEAGVEKTEAAIAEKEEALAGVDRMRLDWDIAGAELPNKPQARDLANTLAYLGSFAATVVQLLQGFIFFQRWAQGGRVDGGLAQRAVRHLENAETNWQQHVHHHATLPGAPSVLHDNTLWERTNACLAALEPRKQA
jgi:hypothetical protein